MHRRDVSLFSFLNPCHHYKIMINSEPTNDIGMSINYSVKF